MELYLTSSITYNIYGYITWNDLRQMDSIPDDIWKRIYDGYYADPEFKKRIDDYWFPNNICYIPHQKMLLYFINMLIGEYKGLIWKPAPSILFSDEDFMLSTLKYNNGALNDLLRNNELKASNTLIKNRYFLLKALDRGCTPMNMCAIVEWRSGIGHEGD